FSRKFCKEGNFLFTNNHVSLPVKKMNRVEKNLFLIKSLELEVANHDPIIPISDKDREFADTFIPAQETSSLRRLIIMHPGSSLSTPYKRWNHHRFSQLADTLIQKYQAKIFFTAGKDEWPLIKSITDQMTESDYVLCRTETLTQLAEIIRRCDLYIGNDTAPMHLAAFLGTPVIAIFGPTDPVENAPYGKGEVIMIRKDVSCNPCRKRECQKGLCMDAIEVKDVVESVERILF
ncbi:MAG: glycosyltransferase family 9 protein, partial [Proteobacteria bacterium]|nr:glycosyltransferase family 9 protein [Pseudomonadota bacterium]